MITSFAQGEKCGCTKILLGGLNVHPLPTNKQYVYIDNTLEFLKGNNPECTSELLLAGKETG